MTKAEQNELALLWMQRARSDLILCKIALHTTEVLPEDICFHAQQSVEKAVKGLLISLDIAFPKTHSIGVLLDLLKVAGLSIPPNIDEADYLTQYAVQTRYLGDWDRFQKTKQKKHTNSLRLS